ncbi:hypothetical protein [Roseateles sp. L2-2]|uniref:hypothetical protein n=1 Tax=Roseateles TaxID=93681 RepID=UPI00267D1DAD
MTHLQVLLVSTIAWWLAPVATALEYRSRNHPGGVSIFPAPFMPFVFWGLAYVFHRAHLQSGVTAMGVLHLPFLAWMIGSMALSGWIIYREGKAKSMRRQDGEG